MKLNEMLMTLHTNDVRTGIESFSGRRTGCGWQKPCQERRFLTVAVDEQSSHLGIVNVITHVDQRNDIPDLNV